MTLLAPASLLPLFACSPFPAERTAASHTPGRGLPVATTTIQPAEVAGTTPTPAAVPAASLSAPHVVSEGPPYTTLAAAQSYVAAQPQFARFRADFSDTGGTWGPGATLGVVAATPFGPADFPGTYYYFFANGYPAGLEFFSHPRGGMAIDGRTYSVTYEGDRPGDGNCCPSGGRLTVRLRWDGASLVALDPLLYLFQCYGDGCANISPGTGPSPFASGGK